jgi:hypothetical protein
MAAIVRSLPPPGATVQLQLRCELNLECVRRPKPTERFASSVLFGGVHLKPVAAARPHFKSAATGVFTATADFHHLGSLGVFAVFAAVFAVWFGRTIARSMSALFGRIFSHCGSPSAQVGAIKLLGDLRPMLGANESRVKHEVARASMNHARVARAASFQQTRQPMHDIERELTVVDAGTVHAKRHLVRSGYLRGQHRSFTEHDNASFAERHRNALRASGC